MWLSRLLAGMSGIQAIAVVQTLANQPNWVAHFAGSTALLFGAFAMHMARRVLQLEADHVAWGVETSKSLTELGRRVLQLEHSNEAERAALAQYRSNARAEQVEREERDAAATHGFVLTHAEEIEKLLSDAVEEAAGMAVLVSLVNSQNRRQYVIPAFVLLQMVRKK